MNMEIISIWNGKYNPKDRFCPVIDSVSRTIQDAIVDIPSLLKEFNGRLDDLFNKYNNGLVFESTIGVFLDELNADEVAKFNKFTEEQKRKSDEAAKEAELFEQFKADVARRVAESRKDDTQQNLQTQQTQQIQQTEQ